MNAEQISLIINSHLKHPADRKQLKQIANSQYKIFLSDTAPVPNLEIVKKFVGRVLSRCHIQEEQILQAYMLMLKFCQKINFSINPYSWQRLLAVSFQLLNKYFNDRYIWVHEIVEVGQFEEAEFVEMEMVFIQIINFELYYDEEEKLKDLTYLKQQGIL